MDEAGLEGERSESLRVTIPTTGSNDAVFVGIDNTTGGAWKGAYGADGYDVRGAKAVLPAYARATYGAAKERIHAAITDEPRALQNPTENNGIAACLYGDTLVMDIQIAGDDSKPVTIYLLDWEKSGRVTRCELLDGADDEAIDSREVGNFNDGKYLRYSLKGHVKLRLTAIKGSAVLSGVFFGAQSSPGR